MRWFTLISTVTLLGALATATTTMSSRSSSGRGTDDTVPENCFLLPDNNDPSGTRLQVTCRVHVLDGVTANLSSVPADVTSKLRVHCNDALLHESLLPRGTLQRLHDMQEFTLDHCKLLNIDANTFEGLYKMKRLSINSHNAHWGSSKTLELVGLSFNGLKELQSLDLGDNNVRVLPDGVFCPLSNLQVLNLTRNRIRVSERLGFGDVKTRMSSVCSSNDLQVLDLSYNELRSLSENSGFARLRRLHNLELQANNISEIGADTFKGLVSLRMLNLANNKIETLPSDLFDGCKDLREVHLQNNSLFSLAKGLFHRLEQLLVLDLSGNQLTSNHVDAGTFTGLIRLIILNLSHNALTRIDSTMFKDLYFLQILDLRNNTIGFVEDNALLPLYNLHTLNLAENRLTTVGSLLFNGLFVLSKLTLNNNLIASVDARAFHNCSALKELDLSSNTLQDVPEAIQELTFLKSLDLGENQISDFKNGSFRNLDQLTGLRLIDNNIGNLTQGMFWDLPSLQVLNLAKNKVQGIERGTFDRNTQIEAIRLDENYLTDINGIFSTLSSLLWLNLSENHLVWFDYAFIPSHLKWLDIHGNFIEHLGNYYKIQEVRVNTLDASHNRITEINAMSIPNSIELVFINNNFIRKVHANTFIDKASLVRVDMYANDLVNLELNALMLTSVPANRSLPELYLGGNPFHCDCTMEWLQRINNMTAARQYPKVMDLENVMCRMTHSRGMTHMPLTRARPGDFLCTYETHCFALCHCCDFDACDCEMTCPNNCSCYHDHTWNTNIVDCSAQAAGEIPHRIPMDATEVYLDGNQFKELQNHVFIGRKNMRVLYVNNSAVETIQNRTFNGLNTLEILHLEENKIRELKGYEFEHLINLRELYLQNNVIGFISNQTLAPLHSLEILRLDGNKLVAFPIWQLNAPRLTELSLAHNEWSCRCKFLQALTAWVSDNAARVLDSGDMQCVNSDSRPPQRRDLDFNSTACSDYYAGGSVIDSMLVSDYLPMAIGTLFVILVLLLVLVLFFMFRDTVRVWLYSRYGVRLCSFRAAAAGAHFEDRDKLYDGFLCYSPKDEEWVVQSLAAELETGFQLCLQYRDLPHAVYLQHAAPAILEAAESSRRVIIVLTRNFLQTEWSRFELRQALHEALKGRVFKLIILEEEPLPEAELDPELRPYLKTGQRVRWGEKRFWEKLRYSMPSVEPRGKINANYRRNINNYTIESRVVANGTHHGHHHHLHHHQQAPPAAHHGYPEKLKSPAAGATAANGTAAPPSPGMFPPPAYTASGLGPEADEANYSSATTATPSPRPSRRQHHQLQQQQHQLAQSQSPQQQQLQQAQGVLDGRPLSDHIYSSIDSDYSTLERGGSSRGRGPSWRHQHQQQHQLVQQHQQAGGAAQAYLV